MYKRQVQVHTTDAGIIRSYITFQKFEELLEGMKCFLSCYRGCIVNMDHIEKSTDEGFVMDLSLIHICVYALSSDGEYTALVMQFANDDGTYDDENRCV